MITPKKHAVTAIKSAIFILVFMLLLFTSNYEDIILNPLLRFLNKLVFDGFFFISSFIFVGCLLISSFIFDGCFFVSSFIFDGCLFIGSFIFIGCLFIGSFIFDGCFFIFVGIAVGFW